MAWRQITEMLFGSSFQQDNDPQLICLLGFVLSVCTLGISKKKLANEEHMDTKRWQ